MTVLLLDLKDVPEESRRLVEQLCTRMVRECEPGGEFHAMLRTVAVLNQGPAGRAALIGAMGPALARFAKRHGAELSRGLIGRLVRLVRGQLIETRGQI